MQIYLFTRGCKEFLLENLPIQKTIHSGKVLTQDRKISTRFQLKTIYTSHSSLPILFKIITGISYCNTM